MRGIQEIKCHSAQEMRRRTQHSQCPYCVLAVEMDVRHQEVRVAQSGRQTHKPKCQLWERTEGHAFIVSGKMGKASERR